MTHAPQITQTRSASLANLDLENLERFGIYQRLHYEGRSFTNLEELSMAGTLARILRDRGVGTGDRVLVMMPNSPELTAAFPAIWTIGATIVPVIPQWTAAEISEIFRGSGAVAALTVPRLAPRVAEAAAVTGAKPHLLVFGETDVPRTSNLGPLLTHGGLIETPVDRAAEDVAILLYTSGTTGTPKGVTLTHGNFLAALDGVLRQNPDIGPGPMLHPLPLTHVYGVLMQFLANRWGISSVLLPHFEPRTVLEAIERYGVEYMPVVPTMLVYLLHHPDRARFNLSSLRHITSGGAPLAEPLRVEFERVFGCRVLQGYGLSESASVATSYQLDQEYRPGSCGQAVPGVEIRIAGDQDQFLAAGEPGEIWLRGASIAAGYWKDPEATQRTIRDSWLRTGDVGYLDEEGYLFIIDRKKDLIIKGGENVSPREIEEALYLHPAVAEAAVVGVPDPLFGEDIWAAVQLKRGAAISEAELLQHAAQHVTKFKVPSRVVFLETLPLSSNGKISKRLLREQFAETLTCCNAKAKKS
jgi:long-chain acyl-CoA synthetase